MKPLGPADLLRKFDEIRNGRAPFSCELSLRVQPLDRVPRGNQQVPRSGQALLTLPKDPAPMPLESFLESSSGHMTTATPAEGRGTLCTPMHHTQESRLPTS